MPHNPMCDGCWCRSDTGPVKLYPTGGGGNMIYCQACFAHENGYRRMRALETGQAQEFWPQVSWDAAKPYPDN